MTGGNKINGFLTARKKIYDKQEKNQCFFVSQEKKSMNSRKKIYAM